MGYVSVRGGLEAIEHAERLVDAAVRDPADPVAIGAIRRHLRLAVDKVMAEGSLFDPELGALAIKQAEGDVIEASFLLRAYRSTLPRLGYSLPTAPATMRVVRRISSAFRDIPGGQVLGRTRDYTQRLLDFSLLQPPPATPAPPREILDEDTPDFPLVIDTLRRDGLLAPAPPQPSEDEPFDVTRDPLRFPAPRSARLQVLARGEAGAMLSLAYASMRGWGKADGYVGEARQGDIPIRIAHPVTGRPARIGWLPVTEMHMVFGGKATLKNAGPDYTLGYGITLGSDERKAIAMGIIDENLTYHPTKQDAVGDEEYVLHHVDGVEASGFVEHLKLPHYVTFQAHSQRLSRLGELMQAAAANA